MKIMKKLINRIYHYIFDSHGINEEYNGIQTILIFLITVAPVYVVAILITRLIVIVDKYGIVTLVMLFPVAKVFLLVYKKISEKIESWD
jgi:hypothetical protein